MHNQTYFRLAISVSYNSLHALEHRSKFMLDPVQMQTCGLFKRSKMWSKLFVANVRHKATEGTRACHW